MLPILEAIIAGLFVGAVNRLLPLLEHDCPEGAQGHAPRRQ
jgi:hypothetical protein